MAYEPPPAAPCPDERPGGGVFPGKGLEAEPIRQVMMTGMGAMQACYEIALGEDADAAGTVTLAFRIGPDGAVQCSSVASSTLRNARVEACMLKVLEGVHFPAAEKPTNVSFPFTLRGK